MRRTGRTTEMLKAAMHLATTSRRRVLVLVAHARDVDMCRLILNNELEAPGCIDSMVMIRPYNDVYSGRLMGFDFSHVLEDNAVAAARESDWKTMLASLCFAPGEGTK